jgi:predicted MFS family arabinose efflux permease
MTNSRPIPGVTTGVPEAPLRMPARRRVVKHGSGFWLVAAAYLVAMALNAVPTPLYPLYQARDGFSTLMVTVIFGLYAAGLAVSLLLAGHISDWMGRKRIIIPALVLEVACAAIFVVFPGLAGLLAGRFVGGLGTGMLTSTATAHLHELRKAHRPDDGPVLFEVVSTGANVGGLAVGPLIAGALAQYVTQPLRVPYIVFGVLLLAAIAAVAITPETVAELPVRPSYRPQRVSMDHGDRAGYLSAAVIGFAAFAINGVYTALSAGFVAGTLHRTSHLLAGAVAFALLAAATVAQTATSRLSPRSRQGFGLAAGAAGFILLAIGIQAQSLTVFLLAGIIGGAGSGMLFKSAIGAVAAMAAPAKRGEALSGLFLICYAGMSLPAIGVGVAVSYFSLTAVMYWFSGILLAVLAGAAIIARRTGTTRA